jgi:hypothetical protein
MRRSQPAEFCVGRIFRGEPLHTSPEMLGEDDMNEDAFNMSVRKFLKKVGVTAQREIEQAVREAEASGKLGVGALPAKATFTIGGVNLTFDVTGEIETG